MKRDETAIHERGDGKFVSGVWQIGDPGIEVDHEIAIRGPEGFNIVIKVGVGDDPVVGVQVIGISLMYDPDDRENHLSEGYQWQCCPIGWTCHP